MGDAKKTKVLKDGEERVMGMEENDGGEEEEEERTMLKRGGLRE